MFRPLNAFEGTSERYLQSRMNFMIFRPLNEFEGTLKCYLQSSMEREVDGDL
jgi:hypothetical protein